MIKKQFDKEPEYLIMSKRKCKEVGMDPDVPRHPKHIMSPIEFAKKKEKYKILLEVVSFFCEKILKSFEETPVLIVISDENGFLLKMLGDKTMESTLELLGIRPGIQFSEADMGTNAVSLSLQENCPVQLIGNNHYHTYLYNTACYGTPFHDKDEILGAICIMTSAALHSPYFPLALDTVAAAIERELLFRKQNQKQKIEDIVTQVRGLLKKTANSNPNITPLIKNTATDVETLTCVLLQELGVSAHLKGYTYLREAILQVLNKPNLIHSMTKDLYPNVAAQYETTESKVERVIRHAIKVAWERNQSEYRKQFFSSLKREENGRPTNYEFIATLAERLRMNLKCVEHC